MDLERLHLLLHRYFDQLLSGEELAELEQMLLESSLAREEFWEMARWNALLRQWGQAEWGRRDAAAPALRALPSRPKVVAIATKPKPVAPSAVWWHHSLAMAATVMLAFFAGWAIIMSPSVQAPLAVNQSEPANKTIAILTHASAAVWADGSPVHHTGETLQTDWLHLKSGAVQVDFSRGARVVVEGPADFQLVSESEGFLQSGKVRALVPEPAHGFKVRAPNFSVVDLGTEFGCLVPLTGAAEVHVFTGGIELHSVALQADARQLRENQAVRLQNGQTQDIAADRTGFLSEEELVRRERNQSLDRLNLWRQAARKLDENPTTIVHFDFERKSEWERTLANRARQAPTGSVASIIGCDWENGRWPQKGGLEFKRTNDRLRASMPGSYRSLTLLAWVRVDSLAQTQQSLLMTESFLPGELHWYLYGDGSLGFGVRVNNAKDNNAWRGFRTEPLVKPETFGSWVFVATVFDGATGRVTHYFNGKPAGSAQPGIRVPLRLDTFEIGNWGVRPDGPNWARVLPDERRKFPRNFHGRIDEFAILSTPLDDAAIERIYQESGPSEPEQK